MAFFFFSYTFLTESLTSNVNTKKRTHFYFDDELILQDIGVGHDYMSIHPNLIAAWLVPAIGRNDTGGMHFEEWVLTKIVG